MGDELTAAASLWSLGSILDARLLTAGRNNDSYHLSTSTGAYVLRRSRIDKTEDGLAFEHAVILHLQKHGLPVPELISSRAGRSWELSNSRFWTVSRFVPGTHPKRNEHTSANGGVLMAQYHEAMIQFDPSTAVPCEQFRAFETVNLAESLLARISPDSHLNAFLLRTKTAAECAARLLQSVGANLPKTVIHGSCRLSSLLTTDGGVAALLDMDSARYGTRIEDIGIALASFAKCRDGSNATDEWCLNAFCRAYTSYLPVTENEAATLPAYLAQALLYPWAKTVERHMNAGEHDRDSLVKAEWRLAAAEHAFNEAIAHKLRSALAMQ